MQQKVKRFMFFSNITFSSQSFLFCQIALLNFVFLLFFDTKLPWRFWRKTSKTWQKAFFQLQKVVKSFTISWNSTFFLQVPQFRQIVLLNFEKDTKHSKKDLIHLQQKLKRIAFSSNITFSSQFFVFCQIALLNFVFCCFLTLNYLDGFGRKRRKLENGLSLSCNKHSKSHFLFEDHCFCAIFLSLAKLHSFIQYFRELWKKSKNFAFLRSRKIELKLRWSWGG